MDIIEKEYRRMFEKTISLKDIKIGLKWVGKGQDDKDHTYEIIEKLKNGKIKILKVKK